MTRCVLITGGLLNMLPNETAATPTTESFPKAKA